MDTTKPDPLRLRRIDPFLRIMERAEAVSYEGDSLRFATAYRDRAALAKEVKRLRKIVDKLPRTADGVPVVAGKTCVFHSILVEEGEDCIALIVDAYGWAHGIDPYQVLVHRRVDACYSTHDIALACKRSEPQ